MTPIPTTVAKIRIGSLYVTGPTDRLFVKVNSRISRDPVTDFEFQHVNQRQCFSPIPRDFRTAALRLSNHAANMAQASPNYINKI
jgi:hypothetical protein